MKVTRVHQLTCAECGRAQGVKHEMDGETVLRQAPCVGCGATDWREWPKLVAPPPDTPVLGASPYKYFTLGPEMVGTYASGAAMELTEEAREQFQAWWDQAEKPEDE